MRFLTAAHRTGAQITTPDTVGWASEGELVVPNFPTGAENTFLGTLSWLPVPYAHVDDVDGVTLDDIADRMKTQYPGLPGELHEAYVLATAKAAAALPIRALLQVYVDADSAKLAQVNHHELYTLWDQQPIPERYR